jgi:two-component system, cell cycle sensor histidine kinase and response regulator CckA
MNDDTKRTILSRGALILGGAGFIALFWILSAAADAFLFHNTVFRDAVFSPSRHELLHRAAYLALILAFASVLAWIVKGKKSTEARLAGSERRFGDIMDRTIREREARYRDLFENANDLIQSVGQDGRFLYVNRAWRETLGYSEEEVARLTFPDVIHPASRDHCMRLFGRLSDGENIQRIEMVFMTKLGSPVIVEGNVSCGSTDGAFLATRGIFRDMTGQRRAEEFVRHVLDSLDDGFVVVDRDYRIASANKTYRSMFADQDGDVAGRPCFSVMHGLSQPCRTAREECPAERTFRTGEPCTVMHVHQDRQGNTRHLEVKALPLRDPVGRIVSVIVIYRDVTERKKLEDQLRHAQKMEAVGTMAGGIAHDFNNILTAIIGYGTLLQMKAEDNAVMRSYIDQILAATERAADLTQGLLAFSRKQPVNLRTLDLNALILNVRKLIERLIGEDIRIILDLAQQPVPVLADAGQLEQILMNLAANARDAMPGGGILTIRTGIVEWDRRAVAQRGYGEPGTYAVLSIVDTGAGMDEKTRQRIFEPFFTTKEQGKGTGLGLSIAYGIVKQHNGYIDVTSEPGAGAAFSISLPLAHGVEAVRSAPAPSELKGGSETILVGEDDEGVRGLMRSILESVGYRVIEAVDGEDVVVKFMAQPDAVDLLFLDIIMPKLNGSEAFAKISAVRPGARVLFASGYPVDMLQSKGLISDAWAFISKPVSPPELLRRVQEILHNGK